jgi:hypothetical protein
MFLLKNTERARGRETYHTIAVMKSVALGDKFGWTDEEFGVISFFELLAISE